MARRFILFGLGALAALASGCLGDNQLSGSLSAVFPLESSSVEVLRNDEAFQVSYYGNRGPDEFIVARVTVALDGITVKNGAKIPLQDPDPAPLHARTTVIHQAAGEPVRVLPKVHLGDLVIESGGNPGEFSRGHFSMSFEPGDAYGAGRTLSGTFNSKTFDAGFGP